MNFWEEICLDRAKVRISKLIQKAEARPYVVYYNAGYRWAKRSSFKVKLNAVRKAAQLRMTGAEVWLRVFDPVTQTWSSWNDRHESARA